MAFPSSVPSYNGFTSTHTLSQDTHAAQHNAEQGDIVALSQKLGTGASTPTINTLLRGNGVGTTTYDQVHLATDVSGVLATANGGTGQNSLTGLPLVSPTISAGGSWNGAPVLSAPTIADFSNADHSHANNTNGGTLNGAIALQASSVPSSAMNLSKATDANGWQKYDFNTFQVYKKRLTFNQTVNSGSAFLTLSSTNLPSGMSSLGTNYITGHHVTNSAAFALIWGFEMSTGATTINISCYSPSGSVNFVGWIDVEIWSS